MAESDAMASSGGDCPGVSAEPVYRLPDQFGPGAADWLRTGVETRDAGCYLDAGEAAERVRSGKALLVDVRDARDFASFRIRGSLNLPAYALKVSPYLRGRAVVLVDTGRSYRHLEALCRELRDRGLEVAILDGGLRAWRRRIGALDGSRVAQMDLERMPPEEFLRERTFEHWLGVYTAEPNWDRTELKRRLTETVAAKREQIGGEPYVLIADRDGNGFGVAMAVARGLGLPRAYYLERGLRGYQGHVADQRVAASRRGGRHEPRSCER